MKYLGISVDVFHAFVMIAWVAGIPLLFWHRYRKLTITYCVFAIIFIIINQLSQWFLGECVLTTLARYCYSLTNVVPDNEWFVVRFTKFVFGLTPGHKAIKLITEVLIFISGIGMLFLSFRKKLK